MPNLWLAVGDGASGPTDYLNLLDTTRVWLARPSSISAPDPAPGDRTRLVTLLLNLTGASMDALWDTIRDINGKLTQARNAAGAYGLGTPVTLSIQWDTSHWIYFDVLDGRFSPPDPNMTSAGMGTQGSVIDLFPVPFIQGALLTLTCLPAIRGDTITVSTSGTINLGTSCVLSVPSIPGDLDALVKLSLTDVSTGGDVINRLRIGTRSLPNMLATDFAPIVALSPAGSGGGLSDATAIGGSCARLSASGAWQTIASATQPEAIDTTGLFDVWLRARDQTANLGAPSNLQVATNSGITRVQSKTAPVTGGTSLAPSWQRATTAGNLLVLTVATEGATTGITVPGGWTSAVTKQGSGSGQVAIYYQANAAAQSGSVSVTLGTADTAQASIIEYAFIVTSSPLDKTASNSGSTTGSLSTGSTATTAQAYELCVGVLAGKNGGGTEPFITSGTSGYSPVAFGTLGVSGNWFVYGTNDSVRTTAAAQSASANVSGAFATTYAAAIATFKGVTTSQPALTSGTYTFAITAVDSLGNQSLPSAEQTITVGSNQIVTLSWQAGAGTPSQYRVYFEVSGTWNYLATGSTTTTLLMYTTTGETAGSPPTSTTFLPSELRAQIGLASGDVLYTQDAHRTVVGNSTWEMVYLGTLPLPPSVASQSSNVPLPWQLAIQGKNLASTPTLDVDAVWLIPHDEPQVQATYWDSSNNPMTLTTQSVWEIETRRDLRTRAILRGTGSGNPEAGQLSSTGALTVKPGNALFVFLPEIAGGVSDINTALTVSLAITPRFRSWRGSQ